MDSVTVLRLGKLKHVPGSRFFSKACSPLKH